MMPHLYYDTTLILIPVSRYTYNTVFIPTPGLHHTDNVYNVTYNSNTNIIMPVLTSNYTYTVTHTTPITSTVLLTTVIQSCKYLYNTSRHSSIM